MAVSGVSEDRAALLAQLNGQGSGSSGSTSSVTELGDRFLKLLVTQLKNQDPMNPMENAELTSQLAQMSTVEGVTKLNETMDGLAAQYRASQVLQGSSLIGRQVLAEGDALTLTSEGAVGAVELATDADSVKVTVYDEDDNVVSTFDLGEQDAGLVRFSWDGKDAAGNAMEEGAYSFQIAATAGDEEVETTSFGLGGVLSVSLNDEGMEAEISGMGARDLGQIRQIF